MGTKRQHDPNRSTMKKYMLNHCIRVMILWVRFIFAHKYRYLTTKLDPRNQKMFSSVVLQYPQESFNIDTIDYSINSTDCKYTRSSKCKSKETKYVKTPDLISPILSQILVSITIQRRKEVQSMVNRPVFLLYIYFVSVLFIKGLVVIEYMWLAGK